MHRCVCLCIHIYIYMYMYLRERERLTERLRKTELRKCKKMLTMNTSRGTSLAAQWLRLHASTVGAQAQSLVKGTEVPHAA